MIRDNLSKAALSVIARMAVIAGLSVLAGCGGSSSGGTPVPVRYTVGGTVSGLSSSGLVLGNDSARLSVSGDGPFSFPTTAASGDNYNVVVQTPPSGPVEQCSVENGSGVVGSANVTTINVRCTKIFARFAYVTNSDSSSVSVYVLDSATGRMSPDGYTLIDAFANEIAIDPSGRFAFVRTGLGFMYTRVTGFVIDPVTGTLTNPHTIQSGLGESDISVDPAGRFLYSYSSRFDALGGTPIDDIFGAGSTGSPGTPVTPRTSFLAFAPSGKFAYQSTYSVSNVAPGILAYSVDPKTGALTQIPGSPFAAGDNPYSVSIDNNGRFLYSLSADSSGTSVIHTFAVDAVSGALTAIGENTLAPGAHITSLDLHPSGKFLYAAIPSASAFAIFTISTDTGALTPVQGSPFTVEKAPESITIDPTGEFAYVCDSGATVYSIDQSSGVLTKRWSMLTRTGGSITITSGTSPVTVAPKFAYVANSGTNTVSGFAVDPVTGGLTELPGSPFATGATPGSVAVDFAGTMALVANTGAGSLSAFSIDQNTGGLSAVAGSPYSVGTNPGTVTISPAGSIAYVPNAGSDTVSAFTINPDHSLVEFASSNATSSPFSMGAGTAPRSVALLPTDQTAYVLFPGSNSLKAFGMFNGQVVGNFTSFTVLFSPLDPATSVYPVGLDPRSVTVGSTGRFVYVTNAGSDTISVFAVTPSNTLAEIAGSPIPVPAGSRPSSLAVDPTGAFAYVANAGLNTVTAFAIDAASGALTPVGSPFPSGTQPTWVAVDPSGSFVQVANTGSNSVSVFAIDRSTGALTEVHGSPFATGVAPSAIAITRTLH